MTKGAGLIGTLLVAGVGIAIAVNMAMKGFDTVEYKCTQDLATAQEFEAAPEWTRDTAAESSRRDDYDFQSGRPRESRRRYVVHDRYPNLRCYKKKTGHVDGIEARTKKPSSDGDNGR